MIVRYFKFFKYLFIGASTFFLYYFLLWATYSVLQMEYLYSLTFSYLLAVCFHFLVNRVYTFEAHENGIKLQLLKYIVVSSISYIIQFISVVILHKNIGMLFYSSVFIGVCVSTLLNYFLLNKWVFSAKST
jgi:putative flippase GtrA